MNKEQIFTYIDQTYATTPDYPWNDGNAVLRHAENRKWYGLILTIPGDKLGLSQDTVDILNVKCDPILIGSLRKQPGYYPAYHMNKDRWLTILLDGTVPEEAIRHLLDLSYQLTAPKQRKQTTN